MSDLTSNPFFAASGLDAAGYVAQKARYQQKIDGDAAVLRACESIMEEQVKSRLVLASEAMAYWGNMVEVTGPFHTQTFSGMSHVRVKLVAILEYRRSMIQIIASPSSLVIGIEAESGPYTRRWRAIPMIHEGSIPRVDKVIHEFLTWSR